MAKIIYACLFSLFFAWGNVYGQSNLFKGGSLSSGSSSNQTYKSTTSNTTSTKGASNGSSDVSGQTKRWREELNYGIFAINILHSNGLKKRTIYRMCPACRGTKNCGGCLGSGTCGICHGRGGMITAGYGNYIPCAMCQQTGRCSSCKGTGKCVCASSEYPGYIPGSSLITDSQGNIVYKDNTTSSDGNSSSESSSSGSTHSSGTCTKCGGRKYETTAYSYATASAHGWAQPYHNSAGHKCPYCNDTTDHYHYPCKECRGLGHR